MKIITRFCIVIILNVLCVSSKSQSIDRNISISAYLYNFARNVQWQNETSVSEFNFLIVGTDKDLIREVTKMAQSKTLRNKSIKVSSSADYVDLTNVHLIFVTKEYHLKLVEIFDLIEGTNILLVSDTYPDKDIVMINFYDTEKGTLMFEINKANIINQNLTIMQETQAAFLDDQGGTIDRQRKLVKVLVVIVITAIILGLTTYFEFRSNRKMNESLQAALLKAESADELKSAFLATMSHELRTPLNSIIGFNGMLLQELPGPLNEEQKKQLGMSLKSSRHLLSLINDILDLSKIEAGQLNLNTEKFYISEVILNATELSAPFAQSKKIELVTSIEPGLPVLESDKFRVQQVVINLLNNALKFTERGSVTVEAFKKQDKIVVRVIDTGIGIEHNKIASLFRPFIQIDSKITRKHDGTGLGLSICKKLMTLMSGSIIVESVPGRGSVFTIELPLKTINS